MVFALFVVSLKYVSSLPTYLFLQVEEERQHYREERDRMLRGFDVDMRRVEEEREEMGRELAFLRQGGRRGAGGEGKRRGSLPVEADEVNQFAPSQSSYSKRCLLGWCKNITVKETYLYHVIHTRG